MAKKKVATSHKANDIEKLRRENEALKKELQQKKTTGKLVVTSKSSSWRSLSKWAVFSLTGAIFIVGSLLIYLGMSVVDTGRFMKIAGPLIEQPAVQARVADKTTTALFTQINTEELAREILPERATFLAPSLSAQIEKVTNDKAREVLASDAFQQTWNTTIEKVHERFITRLENFEGDGTLNMQELYDRLSEQLNDGKLSFLAGQQLPPRVGDITLITATWLPTAHQVVSNIPTFRMAAIALFVLLVAVTIAISATRRRTITELSAMIGLLSIFMIISLRILKDYLVATAKPENQDIVSQVATVFNRPLALQLAMTAIISFSIALLAWLSGQSRSSKKFKTFLKDIFSGKLHSLLFKKENSLTLWVGKYNKFLYAAVSGLYLASLLVIDLGSGMLSKAILTTCLAYLVIIILTPQEK
jgi:hypothetical protein